MKNKFIMLVLAFIAGAIIGVAIVWMLCNCCSTKSCCSQKCGMSPDTTGIQLISKENKKIFLKAYLDQSVPIDTLKAFAVNLEQLNAMKLIAKRDTTVVGFRIYMGLDGKTPVRMVVGFGSPDHEETIYETSGDNSGPCPEVCDEPTIEK